MHKVKYYYDPDTLSYRKIEPKKSRKYRNLFFFVLGSSLFGFLALIILLN
ncbi:MAG: M23 family peptidase, partial [Bacteroidota bacterium]